MIAWDTRTSTRQIKQLPCIINQIAIEKDKVVIFGHNPSVIYIWDLSADQIRVLGAYGQRFLWHLDVDGGILVVFESVYAGLKHLTEMQVQQTKWTLTGKLLDKKQFPYPPSDRPLDKLRFMPTLYRNNRIFGHKAVNRMLSEIDGKITLTDFLYDYAIDKLVIRCIDCPAPIDRISFAGYPYEFLTPSISYQWNSHLCQLQIINFANDTSTMRPYQLHTREVRTRQWLNEHKHQSELKEGDHLGLFGNREVFGLISSYGIQLWFFNPKFVPDLPGAEPFRAMEGSE